jgi:hypothetical protein
LLIEIKGLMPIQNLCLRKDYPFKQLILYSANGWTGIELGLSWVLLLSSGFYLASIWLYLRVLIQIAINYKSNYKALI